MVSSVSSLKVPKLPSPSFAFAFAFAFVGSPSSEDCCQLSSATSEAFTSAMLAASNSGVKQINSVFFIIPLVSK
jgi:hypothetical protein